jgi:hypothetical protein
VANVTAQQDVIAALRDFTRPLAQDAELGRIFAVCVEDFDALRTEEPARFMHLAFQFGKLWESAHFQYRKGMLDEDVWKAWYGVLAHYASGPVGRSIGRSGEMSMHPCFETL